MLASKMPDIMGVLQFINRNVCICLGCRPRPSLSETYLAKCLDFSRPLSSTIK